MAPVDQDFPVSVQTAVGTVIAGHGTDCAAVDDDVTVGVDAVPLFSQAGVDMQPTAVDGGDGYVVLVGVDTVVLGLDVNLPAVDGQVKFAVQSLVFRRDGQSTGAPSPSTFMDILE